MSCEIVKPQKQEEPAKAVSHFPFHISHLNKNHGPSTLAQGEACMDHGPRTSLPRVLLAAPISRNKEYILQDWLRHITGFTYPALDIFLVDNSPDPAFHHGGGDIGAATARRRASGHPILLPIAKTCCGSIFWMATTITFSAWSATTFRRITSLS